MTRFAVWRMALLGAVWSGALACDRTDCNSFCANNALWPRLIVGVGDATAEAAAGEDWRVTVAYSDGTEVEPEKIGCPTPAPPPPHDVCTYSLHAGPGIEWMRVSLTTGNDREEAMVDLAPHNYCARQIAYLPVTSGDAGGLRFGEVEYISPCEMRSDDE